MLQPVEKQNTIQRDGVEAVSRLQCSFPFRSASDQICDTSLCRSRLNPGLRPSGLACCVQGRTMKMDAKALARFMSKVCVDADTGCWVWTAAKADGYGRFGIGSGSMFTAHRLSFEHFVGEIPSGLCLDHLCRNRACVNPKHVEPVTWRENTRRGLAPTQSMNRTGACKRGHDAVDPNIRVLPDGTRQCLVCRVAANKRWSAKRPSRAKTSLPK